MEAGGKELYMKKRDGFLLIMLKSIEYQVNLLIELTNYLELEYFIYNLR